MQDDELQGRFGSIPSGMKPRGRENNVSFWQAFCVARAFASVT